MSWILEETTYAGHDITIRYKPWNSKLVAEIRGPRAGSKKRKICAGTVKWKINSKIPFMSPPAKKIDRKVHPIWKEAEKRIDKAIAEYAKKYEGEYQ